MIFELPVLNAEFQTTASMAKWLRSLATVRRLLRLDLFLRDPFLGYCRKPLSSPDAAVLDHATHRRRGGGKGPRNAILSCRQCDFGKGDRTVSEWRHDCRFFHGYASSAQTVRMIRRPD
jgi:hypothetical protein